jgi:hypothetical protein
MRTIVGGRPQRDRGVPQGISRGLDVLLLKASVDFEFRERLAEDWRAAAKEIDLALTASEEAILASVPADTLLDMASRMRLPEEHRAIFLGRAAAAMLAVLAGLATFSCAKPPPPPAPPIQRFSLFEDGDSDVANEPWHWAPQAIVVAGIGPGPFDRDQDFESEDQGPQVGEGDPGAVNEPWSWTPNMPIFGVAPEWNERDQDYESEDEEGPPGKR